jgi:DNA-binding transcriptional LysR family regulator
MNLKHLEVFKAVMTTGSTIAAGSALQMSQSAISRQLTALETELGFPLFHRDRGRLVPTPEAHALIPEVGETIEQIALMRRKADDLRTGAAADLFIKVAFPHSMTTTALPRIVRAFLAERPRGAIEILSGPYDVIEQMVVDRTADLGFVRLPAEEPSVRVIPLVRSRMVCAMPRGHPLTAKETVDLSDLLDSDLILLGRQRAYRRELNERLRALMPTLRCRIETHSVEASCALVAQGLGVSIVPALIASLLRGMTIELRPFRPSMANDYGFIAPLGAPLSRAAAAWIDITEAMLTADVVETEPIRKRSPPKQKPARRHGR